MDKIILGLLMLRGMTVYDIKSIVSSKLNSMCTSSAGSIHTAVDKLLRQGFIDCVEQGRKKIYYITKDGRTAFQVFISTPMNHEKAKNMEESKFFFMGMVEPEKVDGLLLSYIDGLRQEQEQMSTLFHMCNDNRTQIFAESENVILADSYNLEGVKQLRGRDMPTLVEEIYTYQMEILQHCADLLAFEIDWYERLRTRIHDRYHKEASHEL